jgi:hypothetical protein
VCVRSRELCGALLAASGNPAHSLHCRQVGLLRSATLLLCSTLLYSALLCFTLIYSALLCSTLLYSALFCSTLLYSALLCFTLILCCGYSTLIFSTLPVCSTLLCFALICFALLYYDLQHSSLMCSFLLQLTIIHFAPLFPAQSSTQLGRKNSRAMSTNSAVQCSALYCTTLHYAEPALH